MFSITICTKKKFVHLIIVINYLIKTINYSQQIIIILTNFIINILFRLLNSTVSFY